MASTPAPKPGAPANGGSVAISDASGALAAAVAAELDADVPADQATAPCVMDTDSDIDRGAAAPG